MNAERDTGQSDKNTFAITDQSVEAQPDTLRLLSLMERLQPETRYALGLPDNQEPGTEYLTPLVAAFLHCVRGMDPGEDFREHVEPYERALREFFAEMTNAPREAGSCVTLCDGEGILLGLATAHKHVPGAPVYASDRAHRSAAETAEALGMELVTIPSRPDGRMDAGALRRAVLSRGGEGMRGGAGRPGAVVLATCGTATTGSVDDIGALRRAASAAGAVYVHTDATYGGMVAAYAPSAPRWSFPDGADSVSLCVQHVLGLPVHWGITFSVRDIAVSGFRECGPASAALLDPAASGLGTLLVWAALRRLGRVGIRAHILRRLKTAEYATRKLEEAGAQPSRRPESLTVSLARPSDALVSKWHLTCEGDAARINCLGHVTREAVDEFAYDLAGELQDWSDLVLPRHSVMPAASAAADAGPGLASSAS